MRSIVALDLETTGLDPQRDVIIEIGAVRFNGKRIEDEWSTLINPGRRIPPLITNLTGITNAMVANSPQLHEVLEEFVSFVGDAPVLGHNITFDLGFLHKQEALLDSDAMDTYDLASAILPGAGRYNLGALGQTLNVLLPATHRALDDARVTHAVFIRLYEMAKALPLDIIAEIVRLGEEITWGAGWVFEEILRERSRETIKARKTADRYHGPLFEAPPFEPETVLKPISDPGTIDVDEVAALLEHGGAFSQHFPQFEHRSQQVEMLRAVTTALSEGRHLMVEAGTGTGKSMAYLVPTALWATKNNRRVVISTNTINLQDQLINKDIPDLRSALDLNLHAAVLKGRNNYLCPRRLGIMRRRGPQTRDEMRILAKMLVWLSQTQTGDRVEITLKGPIEQEIWGRLSAEDEGCSSDTCVRRMGGICPFHQAHTKAESAHILIVNHALLLADVATGNRVLPDYDHLIVDEAHHLEDATTNALSFKISQFEVERALRELGGPKAGLLGQVLASTKDVATPEEHGALNQIIQRATDFAFRLENQGRNFFIAVDSFLYEQRDHREVGQYAHQERILPATRTQPAWLNVEVAWEEAEGAGKALLEKLEQLGQGLGELVERGSEALEDLLSSLSSLYQRLDEIHENLNGFVFTPAVDRIYWAEIRTNGQLTLHAAPLHIGPLMEKHIWMEKSSVVLTSATLTASGTFDYIRNRLNAIDADELALGSPFDYEHAAMLYLVNDIPEPNDRAGHQRAIEQGLYNLSKTTGGRMLALFTSYAQLQKTSQAIGARLAEQDILLFEQGEGASPHTLLETFRNTDRAVLLGTRAFWEGVDIPGPALSVLAIAKLPFSVPSDPIVASRSETFDDPFYEYSLPEAILRFRQGFGRLIRTQTDHGIVVILDRRVLSKTYGRAFVESLPQCNVITGSLHDLPKEAAKWLGI